jgi:RimJ/RimL family protein N-acetyltransferase
VVHSPALQGTTAGTEAHWLALRELFARGYRRVGWACDSNNLASRKFAVRLGFVAEGVLRQDRAYVRRASHPDSAEPISGQAHHSILDFEWPAVDRAVRAWLAEDNCPGPSRAVKRP